jgi:myo-inositol-1(or 4)-monophosphatase
MNGDPHVEERGALLPVELQQIQETAIRAAEAGARQLESYFRQGHLETSTKGAEDFVTNADHASESAILQVIRKAHGEHAILTEEAGDAGETRVGSAPYTWVIDPLDGTRNFLRGLPIYAVSVACLFRGKPVVGVVLDPQRGELFRAAAGCGAFRNDLQLAVSSRTGLSGAFLATGYPFRHGAALDLYLELFRSVFVEARGVRRCGAAALDLANTAAGVYDGFFEFCLSPWDIAAGVLLIREAAGAVSDLDGREEYLYHGNVIAGAPGVWRELQQVAAHHVTEATITKLVPDSVSESLRVEGAA